VLESGPFFRFSFESLIANSIFSKRALSSARSLSRARSAASSSFRLIDAFSARIAASSGFSASAALAVFVTAPTLSKTRFTMSATPFPGDTVGGAFRRRSFSRSSWARRSSFRLASTVSATILATSSGVRPRACAGLCGRPSGACASGAPCAPGVMAGTSAWKLSEPRTFP
jgi:hypothetical protein